MGTTALAYAKTPRAPGCFLLTEHGSGGGSRDCPAVGTPGPLGSEGPSAQLSRTVACWARPFSSWSPGRSPPPIQNGPSVKNKTEDAMDVDLGKLPLCTQPLDSHQQTRGRLVMCRKGLDKPKEFSRYSALDREVGLALFFQKHLLAPWKSHGKIR